MLQCLLPKQKHSYADIAVCPNGLDLIKDSVSHIQICFFLMQESNRGRSWSQQSASNSGWEDSRVQQPSRSVYDDYPQASSNGYAQQNHQQQSSRDSSFGNASASGYRAPQQAGGTAGGGYKERAAAAARQNARENADKERRNELELQRQTEAAEQRHNSMSTGMLQIAVMHATLGLAIGIQKLCA